MKMMSILTRSGLIALGVILVMTIVSDEMWEEEEMGAPSSGDLASALLIDWSLTFLVLGLLLAMAMVGAAYLVRDERRENLEWEKGGEA